MAAPILAGLDAAGQMAVTQPGTKRDDVTRHPAWSPATASRKRNLDPSPRYLEEPAAGLGLVPAQAQPLISQPLDPFCSAHTNCAGSRIATPFSLNV